MQPYTAALIAIDAADHLSAPAYRTARRLLDRAGDSGVLWLDTEAAMALAVTGSQNTLRRHLIDLAAAGVVDYAAGQPERGVWVRFLAWDAQNSRTECASVITERANMITQCASDPAQRTNGGDPVITQCASMITERASVITQCAQNPPIPPYGWLVGSPIPDPDEPTNQPTTADAPAPEPSGAPIVEETERARSYALLIDPAVGVGNRKAMELAASVTFEELLRYVAAWSADLEAGRVHSTGALVARVEQVLGAPPVSATFRQSDLYARHVDAASERAAVYGWSDLSPSADVADPDDPPPPPLALDDAPKPPPDAHQAAWQALLEELRQSLPSATYDTWLRDTRLASLTDGEAVITVPNAYALDWLKNRLATRLRRTLGQLVGQPLSLQFRVDCQAP